MIAEETSIYPYSDRFGDKLYIKVSEEKCNSANHKPDKGHRNTTNEETYQTYRPTGDG